MVDEDRVSPVALCLRGGDALRPVFLLWNVVASAAGGIADGYGDPRWSDDDTDKPQRHGLRWFGDRRDSRSGRRRVAAYCCGNLEIRLVGQPTTRAMLRRASSVLN